MTTRERIPHTASFLQTFHTATRAADRLANAEVQMHEQPAPQPEVDEIEAVAFVTGRPAATVSPMIKVSGWNVKTGPALVTEKQAKYMISIAHRPSVTDEMRFSLRVRLEQGMARIAASQFISRYKDMPTAAAAATMVEAVAPGASTEEYLRATTAQPQVADGRYAVEDDGTLRFFKVKNGRKPGYVFLDIQASDDWHAIRNVTRIRTILDLIAVDQLSAARRYGMELGKCSRCGRTLTDETSRAYGIGPECRKK